MGACAASTSPPTRTPTSRIRARCRPEARRSRPRPRCVDLAADVGGLAQGAERVIVVKSANRTLIVTVRPATPAARIRPRCGR